MQTHYHQIAGRSLERLAALSDGIFAVSMTLLVLDLHVPLREGIHSERDLLHAVLSLAPRLLTYLMSFLTLGIFWVGQQTQLNHLERSDRHLAWMHLGFLFVVVLIPFSTALLAEYITYRTALVVYWLNIFLLGASLFSSLQYAARAGLLMSDMTPHARRALERRMVIALSIYSAAALLCVISPYVSIAIIVLTQLNFAVAPRIRLLQKL